MPVKNQARVQMRPLSGSRSARVQGVLKKSSTTTSRHNTGAVVTGQRSKVTPKGHRYHKSPEAQRADQSVSPLRGKLTPRSKKGGANVQDVAKTSPQQRRRWRSKTPKPEAVKTPVVRLSDTWKTSGCPRPSRLRLATPTSDLGTTQSSDDAWPRRRSGEDHVDNHYSDVHYSSDLFTSLSNSKTSHPGTTLSRGSSSRSLGGTSATKPSPYSSTASISLSSGTPWGKSTTTSSRPSTASVHPNRSVPSSAGYSSSSTRMTPGTGPNCLPTSGYSGSRGARSKRSTATYDKRSGVSPMFPCLTKDASTEVNIVTSNILVLSLLVIPQ